MTMLSPPAPAQAAEPIRVLIVDGQNNHDWQRTTPYLKSILEKTGRFEVFVSTAPAKSPRTLEGFRPQFSDYDVVLSNYNGETWPEHARKAFEDFVSAGGGAASTSTPPTTPSPTGPPSTR